MINEVFENYEAFYNMVLSTTIMANSNTNELKRDGKIIIDFIGKAYGLSDEFCAYCAEVIFGDLSRLGRINDQLAVYNYRTLDDEYSDANTLLDIKGDVLATLQAIGNREVQFINQGWFDYSHYKTYQANIRYYKLAATGAGGDLISTRQVGILNALGIGCAQNYELAITRLTQCAFWSDVPSMYYLGYLFSVMGNAEKSKLYYELARLCDVYLSAGFTVLPDSVKNDYSDLARVYYEYISSIKQDVIHLHNRPRIDFSFIEAITSDTLDYYERMQYINNYAAGTWKNVTHSSVNPAKKLGFK